jgi:phosphoesterase RecJ-like protein
VNILASEVFFGGGHMNASGGEYHGSLTQAIEAFEKAIPHYLKKD